MNLFFLTGKTIFHCVSRAFLFNAGNPVQARLVIGIGLRPDRPSSPVYSSGAFLWGGHACRVVRVYYTTPSGPHASLNGLLYDAGLEGAHVF